MSKSKTAVLTKGVEELDPLFVDPHWHIDQGMIDLLDAEGYDYDFVKVDMALFPNTFPDQVRNQELNESLVDSYAAAMGQTPPASFPTGTVDENLNRIDLNHRLHGARRAGLTEIIVIRVNKVLSTSERNLIAVLRNNMHGLRMTSQETNAWALRSVIEHGWTVDQTAAKFNVDPTTLRRALSDHNTMQRARTLGVESEYASLRKTPRYQLAASNLHDTPFKATVKMLADHPTISAGRQVELISQITNQTSDSKQVAAVKAARTSLAPPPLSSTSTPTPSPAPAPTPATPSPTPTKRNSNGMTFDEAAGRLLIILKGFFDDDTIVKALRKGNGTQADAVKEIEDGYLALAGIVG